MPQLLDSKTFIAQAQDNMQHTFIDLVGLRLIEVSPDRAVATLAFAEQLQQLTGVFHAGALITLADTTATYACMYWTNRRADSAERAFPLTIQLSTNLVRNTNTGTVKAEAVPVHRGRTTLVVETRLTDANERLLAVVTTHLVVAKT